jgi:hypothetical protein
MRRILLLPLLALAGCATAPASGPAMGGTELGAVGTPGGGDISIRTAVTPVNSTLPYPVARAWPALNAAYQKLGIAVVTADSSTHEITSPDFRARSRLAGKAPSQFLNCGTTGTGAQVADTYSLRLNFHSVVTPTADGSRITTTLDGWARNAAGVQSDPVHCGSNGDLERLIASTALTSVQ